MEFTNSRVRALDDAIDKLLSKYSEEIVNIVAKRHGLDIDADPKLLLFRLAVLSDETPSNVYDLEDDLQKLRSHLFDD